MALFDKKEDTAEPAEGNTPETIKVGETEYSQEDLNTLVGLGKTAQESEERYNMKIDSLYPEFTRRSQTIKTHEEKIEELENQIKEAETKVNVDPSDEQAVTDAKAAARKLGIVLKEDVQDMGFVSKEEFRKSYQQERAAEKLLETMDGLQTTIDGEDGRPKFDRDSMLEYMQETGINDPEAAYDVRFKKPLSEWRVEQINAAKGSGYATLDKGTQAKQPAKLDITRDNLDQLTKEALEGKF